jgi:signal transduction histidine kinase
MAGHGAPVSRGGLAILAVALLGALACLLTDLRVQRALHRERSASAALERETRTVAELGPLLQSSLDLAEVLPAVALRVSDEFNLRCFSVQLVGEQGHLIDVFAIGTSASDAGDQVDARPGTLTELPAGVVGALPLVRTGRTIGRLTFAGRRPLGAPQLAALSAAADLIAVATYNVELFEREQDSATRLRELDQLKDAFLSTISHELRTPLTAISGFVRLLRDRWDELRENQRKEFLDRVHGNTLSLGLLVDDLLDFARLERQALNAPPSPMDLDQQVANTLAQLAPVLGQRKVVAELEPVRALGNAGALERVLANLLTNAAKFSPPESRIVVAVRADAGAASLEVADEGAGIAEADRERVFARFYRGDSDAARGTRGAGIGLSVVRELVHQMGGTVGALPNAPKGTRMVVRLPLEEQLIDPPRIASVPVERTST